MALQTPTIAAPPSTAAVANQILATMAALSGVLTDYNQGSQVRTVAESVGSVTEMQGAWSTALAFQTLIYSALALFGIPQITAQLASGTVTFATTSGAVPPPVSQNVPIPLGTIVQTPAGIQFQTTSGVVLLTGQGAVDAPVSGLVGGAAGNVPALSITQILTGLSYPLVCYNSSGCSGGADAGSQNAALAQFAATVQSIGLSSPVCIADAAIGVKHGNEAVAFSQVFEPWIAANGGAGSGIAGYTVFIDNGSGAASNGLITNVTSVLYGGTTSGGASNASGALGYHDAGVPFTVVAVSPTSAFVTISGTVAAGANAATVSAEIIAANVQYFTLPFGAVAQGSVLDAQIANATLGQLTSLSVTLATGVGGANLQTITPPVSGRVVLGALTVNVA